MRRVKLSSQELKERRRGAGYASEGCEPTLPRVDSLPNQRIDALPEDAREQAYWQVAVVCICRGKGFSEGETAIKAGFSSVEDMYFRLKQLGLSSLLPLREEPKNVAPEAEELRSTASTTSLGKRKARKFGKRIPLPPAEGAINQFKGTLELLVKDLKKLRGLEMYLQSERFVGVSNEDGKRRAWGARQTPPEPLTTLIAIEALVSGHARGPAITYLIDALHPSELIEVRKETARGTFTERKPDPEKVDMEQLDNAIRRLRKQAGDVAKLIMGSKIRRGHDTGEISPRDHSVLKLVKQREQEGISDEQILEEVNRRFDRGPLAPLGVEKDFTLDEIRYLKTLSFEDHT